MRKYMPLVFWIATFQIVSYFMGIITQANLTPWYAELTKSTLTPPGYVFGLVWSILYIILAVIAWQLFHKPKYREIRSLKILFASQILLNFAWTPIFFYGHLTLLALICLVSITLLTTAFMFIAFGKARRLSLLIFPYWLWVCFASYLNLVIFMHN